MKRWWSGERKHIDQQKVEAKAKAKAELRRLIQEEMFSYGSLSQRVPVGHPLRRIRRLADEAMSALEGSFEAMYSKLGSPSVPPDKMLRALFAAELYTVRSERKLMEQMEYNLLFRWFVGLGMNDRVWDASSFLEDRERLLAGEVAR